MSYLSGQLTDNDRSEEAWYLGHGVGDTKQDPRVWTSHLGMGEVEPSGYGQLVEAHTQGDQQYVAYLETIR